MAKLNKVRMIAATFLGITVLGAPTASFAQDFRSSSNFSNCRVDNGNQIAGGVIGAVVGGFLGSELSSRRARTGSTIAGASLGAITGAAIAGSGNNCRRSNVGHVSTGFTNRGFKNRPVYNNTRRTVVSRQSGFNNNRFVRQRLNRGGQRLTRRNISRQPVRVSTNRRRFR